MGVLACVGHTKDLNAEPPGVSLENQEREEDGVNNTTFMLAVHLWA